jgi:hypothetical protein
MTDFFVSYTSADQRWAEWIAYVLEEEGFRVVIQAWDFRPGSNFVIEMQQAASTADRTVMVLSPDYLRSQFTNPEWAAAFTDDPQGLKRKIVPVVVRACQPTGLLKPLVHINLEGLKESDARLRLVQGVRTDRAKPSVRPAFPGVVEHQAPTQFPGDAAGQKSPVSPYMPKLQRAPSDIDKRRFLKQAFETMAAYFQTALQQLSLQHAGIDVEYQRVTALEFRAEIFMEGKSRAACKIWQGGMMSENGISYSEGRASFSSSSCNVPLR